MNLHPSVGDSVSYRPCFGTYPPIVVFVVGHGTKNGQPVYDLSDGHWCYGDQIDRIVRSKG